MGQTLFVKKIYWDDGSEQMGYFEFTQGTWQPVIQGSSTAGTASYSTQSGWYQKINSIVYFGFTVSWSGGNGSGNLLVSGLPEAVNASNAGDITVARTVGVGLGLGINQIYAQPSAGNSYIEMKQVTLGVSESNISYDGSGTISAQGMYQI